MKTFFIALILCTVFSLNAYAEPNGETKIEPAGQTVLLATVDLHKVRAVIQTHVVDIGKIGDGRPKDVKLNCTYSRYPCSAVDIIAIFVDGNSVFVPRSVFSDLADLDSGHIEKSNNGMVVKFDGGDASESYRLEITFNNKQVSSRKRSSGEFPDDVFERTIYTFKDIEN
jgi:hypothetical protein